MYTLDANIFTRTLHPNQLDYEACELLITRLSTTDTPIVVPLIILAEIAASVRRESGDMMRARVFTDVVRGLPTLQLLPIEEGLADAAAEIAADYALRGMDAIYVAVARQHTCMLVTFDDEVRWRAGTVITVQTPAEALAALDART